MPKVATSVTPEVESQLEALRSGKALATIGASLEGSPLGSLPDNVFGFTFSPLNESTPLFATRLFQSFEVHKLSEGKVHLVGFATADEASALARGTEPLDLNLYPVPHGESTSLVDLPLHRVVRSKPVSRIDGNYMPLHVDAAV